MDTMFAQVEGYPDVLTADQAVSFLRENGLFVETQERLILLAKSIRKVRVDGVLHFHLKNLQEIAERPPRDVLVIIDRSRPPVPNSCVRFYDVPRDNGIQPTKLLELIVEKELSVVDLGSQWHPYVRYLIHRYSLIHFITAGDETRIPQPGAGVPKPRDWKKVQPPKHRFSAHEFIRCYVKRNEHRFRAELRAGKIKGFEQEKGHYWISLEKKRELVGSDEFQEHYGKQAGSKPDPQAKGDGQMAKKDGFSLSEFIKKKVTRRKAPFEEEVTSGGFSEFFTSNGQSGRAVRYRISEEKANELLRDPDFLRQFGPVLTLQEFQEKHLRPGLWSGFRTEVRNGKWGFSDDGRGRYSIPVSEAEALVKSPEFGEFVGDTDSPPPPSPTPETPTAPETPLPPGEPLAAPSVVPDRNREKFFYATAKEAVAKIEAALARGDADPWVSITSLLPDTL